MGSQASVTWSKVQFRNFASSIVLPQVRGSCIVFLAGSTWVDCNSGTETLDRGIVGVITYGIQSRVRLMVIMLPRRVDKIAMTARCLYDIRPFQCLREGSKSSCQVPSEVESTIKN